MKYKIIKNIKYKNNFKKNQIQFICLRAIIRNGYLPFLMRWDARLYLSSLAQNANKACLKRYCFLTGRNRGLIRWSNLSRIESRLLSRNKALPSFIKNNW